MNVGIPGIPVVKMNLIQSKIETLSPARSGPQRLLTAIKGRPKNSPILSRAESE